MINHPKVHELARLTRDILNSPKLTAVLGVTIALLAVALVVGGPMHILGDNRGFQPTQPIAYSHKLHAGDLGIQCYYCHTAAEQGKVSGVPALGTCMNCHKFVKKPDADGNTSPEIKKIYDHLGLDEYGNDDPNKKPYPIEWKKVHELPDFVRFNHSPHLAAGVSCQECHGPIQTETRVAQTKSILMGRCINCHRDVKHKGILLRKDGTKASPRLNCSTCHY